MDLSALQESLDLSRDLLQEALTHPSFKYVDPDIANYERMETLGDAVLGLLVMEDLVSSNDKFAPGELTTTRSSMVKNTTLSKISDELGITDLIIAAPSYTLTRRDRANVIEAIFGALFTEGGYDKAKQWYVQLKPLLHDLGDNTGNPIGDLQEYTQRKRIKLPSYTFSKSGPDHNPVFEATVSIDIRGEIKSATATGGSKQKSRESAAAELLRFLADPVRNHP